MEGDHVTSARRYEPRRSSGQLDNASAHAYQDDGFKKDPEQILEKLDPVLKEYAARHGLHVLSRYEDIPLRRIANYVGNHASEGASQHIQINPTGNPNLVVVMGQMWYENGAESRASTVPRLLELGDLSNLLERMYQPVFEETHSGKIPIPDQLSNAD